MINSLYRFKTFVQIFILGIVMFAFMAQSVSAFSTTHPKQSKLQVAQLKTGQGNIKREYIIQKSPNRLEIPEQFTAVLSHFVSKETAPIKGSDGKWHIVYELWLTNGKPVYANIEKIEVLDYDNPKQIVHVIEGRDLIDATAELSAKPRHNSELAPNESMLVFIELSFDNRHDVPKRIMHRLTGTGATNPGSRNPEGFHYVVSTWDVSKRRPPIISPPLRGSNWIAINGCCSEGGVHRGAIQTVNGSLMDSQRYAIDWMKIGKDNAFVNGDPTNVENWLNYNEPVLAVENATVVEVVDGLNDQIPGTLPDPRTITVETVDGNHIVLDLGNGIYAFYAHLKKGSIKVKPGEKVKKGQVIAHLGNSGNTSAPHLHFHLMTGKEPIASDGIPYAFEEFDVKGQITRKEWDASPDINKAWKVIEGDKIGKHKKELPLSFRIVSWPDNTHKS